jgi:hypothetical protein
MTMFTLEIGGKPTAIMNTGEEDARAILEGEGFQEDLKRLKTPDGPVWDGKAPLNLRPSSAEEIAEFEDSQEEDDDEEDDTATILFLVPLDEDDEEDDEDEAEE